MFTYSSSKKFERSFLKHGAASEESWGLMYLHDNNSRPHALGGEGLQKAKCSVLTVFSSRGLCDLGNALSLVFLSAMKNTSYLLFPLLRIATGLFIE